MQVAFSSEYLYYIDSHMLLLNQVLLISPGIKPRLYNRRMKYCSTANYLCVTISLTLSTLPNFIVTFHTAHFEIFNMRLFKDKVSMLNLGLLSFAYTTVLVSGSAPVPDLKRVPPPICSVQCEIASSLTCQNPGNPSQTTTITHNNCRGGSGANKLCNCQGEACRIACSGMGFCTAQQVLAWCTNCSNNNFPCCGCEP